VNFIIPQIKKITEDAAIHASNQALPSDVPTLKHVAERIPIAEISKPHMYNDLRDAMSGLYKDGISFNIETGTYKLSDAYKAINGEVITKDDLKRLDDVCVQQVQPFCHVCEQLELQTRAVEKLETLRKDFGDFDFGIENLAAPLPKPALSKKDKKKTSPAGLILQSGAYVAQQTSFSSPLTSNFDFSVSSKAVASTVEAMADAPVKSSIFGDLTKIIEATQPTKSALTVPEVTESKLSKPEFAGTDATELKEVSVELDVAGSKITEPENTLEPETSELELAESGLQEAVRISPSRSLAPIDRLRRHQSWKSPLTTRPRRMMRISRLLQRRCLCPSTLPRSTLAPV
jgi:hypothetical protein